MEKDNLLFSRVRSLRSRKRIIKKDVEKQIIKKYKRSRELIDIRWNIQLVPLEKPYQKGYVRFFVVREDVKRSKDGDFFEGILKKINNCMYSETRKFLKKKKRKKFGKRIFVEREQRISNIYPWEWENPKLGLTEREKQYFLKKENYCPIKKSIKVYYEFIEPWRFVLRVRPHMITHYKPLDSELEKEYDQLKSYLNQYKVRGFIHKTIYGKPTLWKDKYKRDQMKSIKYFHYNASATEIAGNLEDNNVLKL